MSSREAAYRNPVRFEAVEWSDPRAVMLRAAMDAETGGMYAEFRVQQAPEVNAAVDNALSVNPATIVATVIALDGERPIGHCALRPFGAELEVKKVFVSAGARGTGVARALMAWAEGWARERAVTSLVLQTGALQAEAIALYAKIGYLPIEPFGGYAAVPGARCYRKRLLAAKGQRPLLHQ